MSIFETLLLLANALALYPSDVIDSDGFKLNLPNALAELFSFCDFFSFAFAELDVEEEEEDAGIDGVIESDLGRSGRFKFEPNSELYLVLSPLLFKSVLFDEDGAFESDFLTGFFTSDFLLLLLLIVV